MTTYPSLRVAVGGDHAGFSLKKVVVEMLGHQVEKLIDWGSHD